MRSTATIAPAQSPIFANKPAAAVPMRLAREAGRQAVERSFALPLQAAGFDNAKVVARYPTEGSPVTEPLDRSRSYNEVLEEAQQQPLTPEEF